MNSSSRPRRSEDDKQLLRFTVSVRWIHAATSSLLLVCIGTAAILYNGSISIAIGHRYLVQQIHVWCGFGLPVPLILGLLSPSYRADLKRLNRFTPSDWRWLRTSARHDGDIPVGKFNAGQKLNAAISAGSIGVLFGTGIIMYFTNLTRLSWRSGATFLHDWFSLGLGLLVLGHIGFALRDREAMASMRRGFVTWGWARRQHSAWAAELESEAPDEEQPTDLTSPLGL